MAQEFKVRRTVEEINKKIEKGEVVVLLPRSFPSL